MFDTTEQILDQLRAGEDGRAEFKEVRLGDRGVLSPDTEALAGELVAFANAAGGGVFLGVADSGAVAGISPSRVDAVELEALPTTPATARHHHARRDALPARSGTLTRNQILLSYLSRTWSKRGRRRPGRPVP